MTFRTLLIAIDGTNESQHALNYYAHFFWKPDDDITVIVHAGSANTAHLVKLLELNYGFSGGFGIKESFKKIISEWAKEHSIEEHRIHTVFAVSESEPGKFICNYAANHNLECILMPCHGVALPGKPAKVSRVLEYVMNNWEHPLLVVPLHIARIIPDYNKKELLRPRRREYSRSPSPSLKSEFDKN